MGTNHTQGFCKNCDDFNLAVQKGTNHILHLLLSIITGGLWLAVWIIISLNSSESRCVKCGSIVNTYANPKNGKPNPDAGGNYSIALPISIMFIGSFSLLMAIVRQELLPLALGSGCLIVGYLLAIGRQEK